MSTLTLRNMFYIWYMSTLTLRNMFYIWYMSTLTLRNVFCADTTLTYRVTWWTRNISGLMTIIISTIIISTIIISTIIISTIIISTIIIITIIIITFLTYTESALWGWKLRQNSGKPHWILMHNKFYLKFATLVGRLWWLTMLARVSRPLDVIINKLIMMTG